jgi:hypothetical protein
MEAQTAANAVQRRSPATLFANANEARKLFCCIEINIEMNVE